MGGGASTAGACGPGGSTKYELNVVPTSGVAGIHLDPHEVGSAGPALSPRLVDANQPVKLRMPCQWFCGLQPELLRECTPISVRRWEDRRVNSDSAGALCVATPTLVRSRVIFIDPQTPDRRLAVLRIPGLRGGQWYLSSTSPRVQGQAPLRGSSSGGGGGGGGTLPEYAWARMNINEIALAQKDGSYEPCFQGQLQRRKYLADGGEGTLA